MTKVANILRRSVVIATIDMPTILATPVFVSAEVGNVGADKIYITFDGDLRTTSVPDVTDFALSFSGGAVTVTTVEVFTTHVLLTLSRDITYGETGTITYTIGSTPLKGLNNNNISEFTDVVINNISSGVTQYVVYTDGFDYIRKGVRDETFYIEIWNGSSYDVISELQ